MRIYSIATRPSLKSAVELSGAAIYKSILSLSLITFIMENIYAHQALLEQIVASSHLFIGIYLLLKQSLFDMRKLLFAFMAVAVLASCAPAVGQKLERKERRKWKKKMRKMEPAEFKQLYEDYQQLRGEVASKDRELSTLRKEVMSKDAEISKAEAKVEELTAQMEAKEAELETATNDDSQDISQFGDDYTKGIVYKVQVGAFTKNTYSEKVDGAFWEEDADGTKKYTIGYFRDYQDATRFKNYMRAIGVSDAWIVAYEDNQRKDIKNILDADDAMEMEEGDMESDDGFDD